ncbi:MAG: hypothetical protein OZ928_18285 [Polyangiaceae bacterium]|nr:hypothetical protein [Polyangiaceae bacterium]
MSTRVTSTGREAAPPAAPPAAPNRHQTNNHRSFPGVTGFAELLKGLAGKSTAEVSRAGKGGRSGAAGGADAGGRALAARAELEREPVPPRRERSAADTARDDAGDDAPPPLDPLSRHLAFDRPPALATAAPHASAPPPNAALPAVEELVQRLVRRVAWGGDGRRGTARVELGAGELAGATITVESSGRELHVEVELPPGVEAEPWRERLSARLRARGFELATLEVR